MASRKDQHSKSQDQNDSLADDGRVFRDQRYAEADRESVILSVSVVAFLLNCIFSPETFLIFSRSARPIPSRSVENQQERAVKESSRILKDITRGAKGFSAAGNSNWGKTKRVPRLYFINGGQTILLILQGDITKTKVDAIVNAANEHMTGGGGVDGIIHRAAGNELYDACVAHKQVEHGVRLPTGRSRILLSYNMSSTTNYIINTAGPVYSRYEDAKCARDLSSCYKTALALADLYDLESIGFTAISCGIFGYPVDSGARIALETVNKEASTVPVVVFVLWDDHIYDAWVEAVKKLSFPAYDPQTSSPPTPSGVNDQKETDKENRDAPDDHQQPSAKFNPKVIDGSTPRAEEKTTNDEHSVTAQPPPVLETQKSGDTKPDDDSDNKDTQSKTTNAKNTDSATEQPTTSDRSEQETTKDPTTNDDSNVVEGEKAGSDSVEALKQPRVVTTCDSPNDDN